MNVHTEGLIYVFLKYRTNKMMALLEGSWPKDPLL